MILMEKRLSKKKSMMESVIREIESNLLQLRAGRNFTRTKLAGNLTLANAVSEHTRCCFFKLITLCIHAVFLALKIAKCLHLACDNFTDLTCSLYLAIKHVKIN